MKKEYKGNSRKSGVYQIRNLVDGKVYIGSTKEFKTRACSHTNALLKGQHHNKHLQAAFDRDGEESFVFEVLEVVDGDYVEVEQQYLNQFLDQWVECYNFDKKSITGPRRTFSKTPEETRAKQSAASSGKNNPMYGLFGTLSPKWGVKMSQEAKDKISKARKGRIPNGRLGTKLSEETKEKIRSAHLGKMLSVEHKQKLSESHKGIIPSEETRKRRAASMKKYWDKKKQGN